jgi:hypothetical protein
MKTKNIGLTLVTASCVGDIVLMPLMLNYKFTSDFSINFRSAFIAPTGSCELGQLANTGKNRRV